LEQSHPTNPLRTDIHDYKISEGDLKIQANRAYDQHRFEFRHQRLVEKRKRSAFGKQLGTCRVGDINFSISGVIRCIWMG